MNWEELCNTFSLISSLLLPAKGSRDCVKCVYKVLYEVYVKIVWSMSSASAHYGDEAQGGSGA